MGGKSERKAISIVCHVCLNYVKYTDNKRYHMNINEIPKLWLQATVLYLEQTAWCCTVRTGIKAEWKLRT